MSDYRSTAYDPRLDPRFASTRSDSMVGPILIYVGLVLTLFTGGLSFVAAMITAYVLKADAGTSAWGHYVYAIRTGWWSLAATTVALLVILLGIPLMIVLIGFPMMVAGGLLMTAVTVWFVVRCIVGVARAADGRPVPDPRAMLI